MCGANRKRRTRPISKLLNSACAEFYFYFSGMQMSAAEVFKPCYIFDLAPGLPLAGYQVVLSCLEI